MEAQTQWIQWMSWIAYFENLIKSMKTKMLSFFFEISDNGGYNLNENYASN